MAVLRYIWGRKNNKRTGGGGGGGWGGGMKIKSAKVAEINLSDLR